MIPIFFQEKEIKRATEEFQITKTNLDLFSQETEGEQNDDIIDEVCLM